MKLYRSCKLKDLTFTQSGEIIVTPKHIQPWNITPETRHVTTWFDKPIKNAYHDDVIVEAEFTPEEFGKMKLYKTIGATDSCPCCGRWNDDIEVECQIDEYVTSQSIKADKLYIDRNVTVEYHINSGHRATDYKKKYGKGYDLTEEFPYMINGYRYFVDHGEGMRQQNFVEMVTFTEYYFSNDATLTLKPWVVKHRNDNCLVSTAKLSEIIHFEYTEDVEIFDIDDAVEEVK